MKHGQEKRKRERYSLTQTREALLVNYYENGGDLADHEHIMQSFALSPQAVNEIAVRRKWKPKDGK